MDCLCCSERNCRDLDGHHSGRAAVSSAGAAPANYRAGTAQAAGTTDARTNEANAGCAETGRGPNRSSAFCTGAGGARSRSSRAGYRQRAPLASGQIQLAYEGTDLYSFINQVSDALGITPLVIDPDVKGSVTIHSTAPMSREEVFPLFNIILKNNNAALVKQGNIYQIVPTSSGLKKGVEVIEHLPPPSQPKPGVEKPANKKLDQTAPGVPAKPSAPAGTASPAPVPARPPAADGASTSPRLATHVIHVEFVPVRDLMSL